MLQRVLNKREERAISFQTLFASGDSILFSTSAGTVIDEYNVLKINAVYACVRLIADSIATLPMDTFERRSGTRVPYRPRPEWLETPEIGINRTDHFTQVICSLLLNGNAFVRIIRDDNGVVGLSVLNPHKVEVLRDPGSRRPIFKFDSRDIIPNDQMIHIRELLLPGELRGKSRVEMVKENLGLASALEQFAARFFGGATSSGIIEYPGNLTREQAKDLADSFEQEHQGLRKSHRTGVLFGGAKFQKTTPDNDTAQFIESRRFAVEDICRVFRVPPSKLGVISPGAMSYASVESNAIAFVTDTLRPYIAKIEDAYGHLLPKGVFLRINVDGLLRGDSGQRFANYSTGLASGIYSINDVRRLEDLEPVDGGDAHRVPLANVDANAANIAELDRRTIIAQRLIDSGFQPEDVLASLGMDPIAHTGLPTTHLQQLQRLDPQNPDSEYVVKP